MVVDLIKLRSQYNTKDDLQGLNKMYFLINFYCEPGATDGEGVRYSTAIKFNDLAGMMVSQESSYYGHYPDSYVPSAVGTKGLGSLLKNGIFDAFLKAVFESTDIFSTTNVPTPQPVKDQYLINDVHGPACNAGLFTRHPNLCSALALLEFGASQITASCKLDYKAFRDQMKPFIDESWKIRDATGRGLPVAFVRQAQPLPGRIASDVVLQERSTYAWLYDKIQLLYTVVPCDVDSQDKSKAMLDWGGSSDANFAPFFGKPTFLRVQQTSTKTEPSRWPPFFKTRHFTTQRIFALLATGI